MADLVFETKSVLVPEVCFSNYALLLLCCKRGLTSSENEKPRGSLWVFEYKGAPCKMFGLRSHQGAEVNQSFLILSIP